MLAAEMEPGARETFNAAGAGALLAATIVAAGAVGALIGWALGSWSLGLLGGVVVGIPLGVFVVYRSYRSALS
jgi:F0F1-type ATP synthase assembly protein I